MSTRILKEEIDKLMRELLAKEPPKELADSNYGMIAFEVPRTVINSWDIKVKNPHITIAYFPTTNDFRLNRVARTIQKELQNQKPIFARTEGQDLFGPEKDTKVALVVKTPELIEIKNKLWNIVDDLFPGMVDKKYKEYKPHITYGKIGDTKDDINTDCEMILNKIIIQSKGEETYIIELKDEKK